MTFNTGLMEKTFRENGYLISNPVFDHSQVNLLRESLDNEFKENKDHKMLLSLEEIKNENLVKLILNGFLNNQLNLIKEKLNGIANSSVSILPPIQIMRNYHVNLKKSYGWHRDCGGEMKYDYCKKILCKKEYVFTKIGIFLQENTEYGGSIDVIPKSNKNFAKFKIYFRKIKNIPLKIAQLFHSKFNSLYCLLPESFFMFFIRAKRLFPKIGSAVFFDSRIIHRGSPISKKVIKNVKFTGEHSAEIPIEKTKYALYCHFGSAMAVDSYMFDRQKRKDNFNELRNWLKQLEFIKKFNPKLANQMENILDPIKKKYKLYV